MTIAILCRRALTPVLLALALAIAPVACADDAAKSDAPDAAAPANDKPASDKAADAAEPGKEADKEADADDEKLPPALTEYMGRRIAQTMHWAGAEWLIRATREHEEKTSMMLNALGVKEGDAVCDLGAGNGYLSLKLAKLVGPKGVVYANDIQPEMLRMLRQRAAEAGVENVKTVLGTLVDAKLPAASCDLIVLVDVYHEFDHPVQMLASIRKSLKPTGRVVLVEFRLEDPDVPIKPLHKMSKPQIDKELTANGFKLADSFDELPWQHMVFYQRDDAPADDDKKPE